MSEVLKSRQVTGTYPRIFFAIIPLDKVFFGSVFQGSLLQYTSRDDLFEKIACRTEKLDTFVPKREVVVYGSVESPDKQGLLEQPLQVCVQSTIVIV